MLLLLCFLLFQGQVCAQPVRASAYFEKDTFALGALVALKINIQHHDTTPVIFPSETSNFSPFVYVRKQVVPTLTTNHSAIDQVTYMLQCFDLQRNIRLRLNCHYVQGKDTFTIPIETGVLTLNERIIGKDSLESASFRIQNGVILIKDPINPYIFIGLIVAVVAILGTIVFSLRKPVTNYLRRQLIRREWYTIRRQLQRIQGQMQNQPLFFDELNKIWKEVVGKDLPVSLRSLTTSELLPVLSAIPELTKDQAERLCYTAKVGDKVIYAGIPLKKQELQFVANDVKEILEDIYSHKIQNI